MLLMQACNFSVTAKLRHLDGGARHKRFAASPQKFAELSLAELGHTLETYRKDEQNCQTPSAQAHFGHARSCSQAGRGLRQHSLLCKCGKEAANLCVARPAWPRLKDLNIDHPTRS